MDLLPTDEQSEILNTVRSQLDAGFELSALAEHDRAASVVDDSLWSRCAELGWFSLGLDESLGGIGYGLPEETLLFEQIGAHATPGPFFATVLAVHVAAGAGEPELVETIASGTVRVALGEPESGSSEGRRRIRVTDFGGADLVLYLDGAHARLLDATALDLVPEESFDPLVPLATSIIEDAPDAGAVQCNLTDSAIALRATVLTAAELAGIAQATVEQSIGYAKDREQFGRPVGSFQAVKHRCADMAVRADAAVQLTRLASLAVAAGYPDAEFQAEAARVTAAAAAVTNSELNVQNHGGIGFTYEHTAHRYVTRARVRAATAGNRATHLSSMLAATSPG